MTVVVAVVSLLVTALAAVPAGALTPLTVTVTPTTDLVDGQTIHIVVSGLTPGGRAYSSVCAGTAGSAGGRCDQNISGIGNADDQGTAAFDLTLDAEFLSLDGVTIDCRVAPGCSLVTQRTTAEGAPVQTPLGFRADGPLLPPPTITVTPSSDLVDGIGAHVTGSGFVGGSPVLLVQCQSPFAGSTDCGGALANVTAGADGSITAEVALETVLFTNAGGEVDCRVAACSLVALRDPFISDPRHTASTPLAFRPDGPLLPPGVLTVDPRDALVDGQEIQVSGTGFRVGSMMIGQCAAGTGSMFERCPNLQFTTLDASGAFTTTLRVQVLARISTGFVDCLVAPGCTVAALDINSGHPFVEVPVAFDPDGPVPTPPTLRVAPGGPLAARSPVVVTGEGFEPFSSVSLERCRIEGGVPRACSGPGADQVEADANGALLAGTLVTAVIAGPDGTEIDCRTVTCALVADSFSGVPAIAPLQFQPSTVKPTRYLAPVFDNVDVTDGVVYRHTTNSHGAPVDLALDVYRPAGDTATNRPAVMWMFGGYFGSGERKQLRDLALAMARRGYVSVAIDYRTRPEIFSHGPDGCLPVGGACLDITQLGPAIIDARDDARAAMVWLHDHATEYGIEPRAITAAGWSAGAITALNLAHDATGDRPAASIPAAAVSLSGILTGIPSAADPPSMMLGGNHDSLLALRSQIAGCSVIRAAGSSCEFVAYEGLKPAPGADDCVRFDVPCTYVLGRDAEHGFFFDDRPDVIDRMSTFLARTVLRPVGILRGPGPHHHRHHHHHGGDGHEDRS
ncbi:MAG: neocarzinostatin apoprotein domain-containing protein [Acidimicrobiia bacterium]